MGGSRRACAIHPQCGRCSINDILNVREESAMERSGEDTGRGPTHAKGLTLAYVRDRNKTGMA